MSMPRQPKSAVFGARNLMIAAALVIGGVALALSFSGGSTVQEVNAAGSDTSPVALMAPTALKDNVLGKADAPVTIVEYSSLTCPHCAEFHKNTLPALTQKYIATGKAKYILREFPTNDLAAAAFNLSRCLEGDRYFAFVDLLYSKQEQWAFKPERAIAELLTLAKQAGFTEERFNACLANQQQLTGIAEIRDRGYKSFNVRSTPTFFVNGRMLKGAQSIQTFDEAIAAALPKS